MAQTLEKSPNPPLPRRYKIALADIFMHEEPPISGTRGSGAVFFCGCNLACVFCQNHKISHPSPAVKIDEAVSEDALLDKFAALQNAGAHNINLVTPTPYINFLPALLARARKFLHIPVVYNTNATETPLQIRALENLVDIFLPDIKYFDDAAAIKYSGAAAKNYFARASAAVLEMRRICPADEFAADGIMQRGLLVRHLVLPALVEDSKRVLDFIAAEIGTETQTSVMGQYYPCHRAALFPEINRRLTGIEYYGAVAYARNIGLKNVFYQTLDAADAKYTPDFE